MYLCFSHPISEKTTVVESSIKLPTVTPRSRLSQGSGSNTSYFELFAHAGTHIDAPWHFISEGRKIADFEIEEFIFHRPLLVRIEKKPMEEVTLNDLMKWKNLIEKADILLINTCFLNYRSEEPQKFLAETPGLSVELAEWLASLSNLRCIGIDTHSVENIPRARTTGYQVHHALLGRSQPTLLLEDANLNVLHGRKIKKIFLFPLRMDGLEACPVTAVAEC